MRETASRKNERGVALMLAIVALLLITAAGLALLFSSDTETLISVNYRDKQVAIYGAMAGLEEGRNRIHPIKGDLALAGLVPKDLPVDGKENVLYIINGSSGDGIEPWNPENDYFDTEFCHESPFGTAITIEPGVPCKGGELPTEGWYRAVYNSDDANWANSLSLSYKWIRVTLKHSNMTPAVVSPGGYVQLCWDGNHQKPIDVGSKKDCTASGDSVTNIMVLDPGTKYTSKPTVTISGGSGSGATAEAIIGPLPAGLTSVTMTDGGFGYTEPPAVHVVPADGYGGGAQVLSKLVGGRPVESITLNNAAIPACYPEGTAATSFKVNFDPTGATGQVTGVTGRRCIYSFTVTKCNDSGSGGKNLKGVPISAPGGFSGTFDTDKFKNANNFVISSFGNSDYPSKPHFTVGTPSGGGSCTITDANVAPVYGIQIASATGTGGSFSDPPKVYFTGPIAAGGRNNDTTGTGNLSGSLAPSALSSIYIAPGMNGSGYLSDPGLVIDPPPVAAGNRTATGTASIEHSNGVIGIKVLTGGHGYSSTNPPTVTISAPGVGGVTAKAVASVGSGGNKGAVYMITALAQTKTGARAMAQMEVGVTYAQYPLVLPGALTLAGPKPTFNSPNANGFFVDGNDHAASGTGKPTGCDGKDRSALPAIGVYDDPKNPTVPSAQESVIGALGKPKNYIGKGTAPNIENVFGSLAGATPATMNTVVDSVASIATNIYGAKGSPTSVSTINMGSSTNPAFDVIYGDYTMSGNQTGYGLLVVTGKLTFSGNFSWNGVVMVIGEGAAILNGGGNGQINGSVFVANTAAGGATLAPPTVLFSGGGGNGIYYDHCWADDMLAKVPWIATPAPDELKVISLRMIEF